MNIKVILKRLYNMYFNSTYLALRADIRNEDIRRDAISQVFTDLFSKLNDMNAIEQQSFLQDKRDFGAYIYRAALYKARTEISRLAQGKSVHQQHNTLYGITNSISPPSIANSESWAKLENQLSTKDFQILELIGEQVYTHQEIAHRVGVPVGGFRAALHRARKKAKKILAATWIRKDT